MDHEDCRLLLCPCQRVLGWIPLPYCYRGYGRVENASKPMCKVHLIDDKVPVHSSQVPCITKFSKIVNETTHENSIQFFTSSFSKSNEDSSEAPNSLSPKMCLKKDNRNSGRSSRLTSVESSPIHSQQTNYANMEFAESLEFYENSRELIKRTGLETAGFSNSNSEKNSWQQTDIDQCFKDTHEDRLRNTKLQICSKCGHECNNVKQNSGNSLPGNEVHTQDDYTLMDPDEFLSQRRSSSKECLSQASQRKSEHTEYLHMSPLTNSIVKHEVLNPHESLSQSVNNIPCFLNRSIYQAPSGRIPGKAVLCREETMSPPANVFARTTFKSGNDETCTSRQLVRRRSNSVDCGKYSDENLYHYFKMKKERNELKQTLKDSQNKRYGNLHGISQQMLNPTTYQMKTFDNDKSYNSPEETRCRNDKLFLNDNNTTHYIPQVHVQRSSSIPCKSNKNRDSSSSNDSGVSAGSPKFLADFDHVTTNQISSQNKCLHSSLPRKLKNTDPLQELSFHFQTVKVSSDADSSVPGENKGDNNICTNAAVLTHDSHSTSSATSDMSDYIETLSLSSYSSSDTPESLRLGRTAVITLKPRSGKEYQKVDRCSLDIEAKKLSSTITEKSESPSPGYSSGSPHNLSS